MIGGVNLETSAVFLFFACFGKFSGEIPLIPHEMECSAACFARQMQGDFLYQRMYLCLEFFFLVLQVTKTPVHLPHKGV